MRVQQSSLIAFYLLAAFVVFITMRGELSVYLGFLMGAGGKPRNDASLDTLTGASGANADIVTSTFAMLERAGARTDASIARNRDAAFTLGRFALGGF